MTGRPELVGTFGAVTSTHWLASSAGMSILEQGGNAFDAAVAAGFVLQVVEPHSNGLGGDLSVVLHEARSGRTQVICGQGPMPRAATEECFQDLGLSQIPGSGLLPACVPGAFGGWLRLLAEFGTKRLGQVMEAAIGYAE
ncbi:MAG: gamma-glutamyltranspeptidase / glutathione hydrolase, partial [Pseudonocardiales bacterium]|nr:gamma-glutamyltranspeptidase / glutathione hydrolase [Pseudonocardiales bacterium]